MHSLLKRDNIGFAGLQWFFWSAICTLTAFLVVYLKSQNYNEVEIGVIMSSISLGTILGQPFWGHISDRTNRIRNILIACFLFAGFGTLLIPVFIRFFLVILVIGFLYAFTENSMISVIDSWTLHTAIAKPWIDYGATRAMGSLGYALTAVVLGVILDRFGYGWIFPIHLLLVLTAAAFCLFAEINGRRNVQAHESSVTLPPLNLPESLNGNTRRFVWFLISSTLVFVGYRGGVTFYPLLIHQLGGGNTAIGLSLFVTAVSEVPVLFLSKKLLIRFKDTTLIAVSLFFAVIRIFLHIVIPSVGGLIALQALQALAFALFLPAFVFYVRRIAPPKRSATYLTIASSCYFGVGGILGNISGGLIIERFGIYPMFMAATAIASVGTLIFIFSSVRRTGY